MSEETKPKAKPAKAQVVPTDIAEQEFERFCEAWDIFTDTSRMSLDDAQDFERMRVDLIVYIEDQRIEVLEDASKLRINLKFSDKITSSDHLELDVSRLDMIVTDRHAGEKGAHKMGAIIAEGCEVPERHYSKVDPRDKKIFQKVVNLFLG